MRRNTINAALIAALAGLLLLTACGRNKEAESTPPPVLRTPIPTFTPTVSQSSIAPDSAAAPENAQASSVETNAAAQAPVAAVEVAAAAPAPTQTAGFGGPVDPPQLSVQVQPALGIINTQLVNARSGPATDYGVVMILGYGENYDITGKSSDGAWWRVCCIEGQEVWVSTELIDATGNTESLPVAQAGESSGLTSARSAPAAQATISAQSNGQAAPQSASQPAAEAAAVQAPAAAPQLPASVQAVAEAPATAPESLTANTMDAGATDAALTGEVAAAEIGGSGLALELAGQEQFPETGVVRVFMYAYKGTEALEGYTLHVTKDGVEQAQSGASFGGRPGMTWPIASDRQRYQNLKVEFPGVSAAGTWVVTVMKDGAPAGPAATFVLGEGETNQELYVRYAQQ